MGEQPDKQRRVPFRGPHADRGVPATEFVQPRSTGLSSPDAVAAAAADAGLIIFNWSFEGGIDIINDAGLELLGYRSEEMVADREIGRRAVHPDSKAVLLSMLSELEGGAPVPRATEVRLIGKGGREFWLEARLMPVISADASIVGLKGVALEATALVEGRQESADGWEHYRRLFDEAPVAMWLIDPEHDVVLEANRLACEMHGYGAGELDGVPLEHLVPADSWLKAHERLREWQKSGRVEVIERTEHQRKDGTVFAAQICGGKVRVGGRVRRLSFIEDLTKREAAEGDHNALRAVADAAAEGFVVIGPDGRIAFANQAAGAALGRLPGDLRGEDPEVIFGQAAAGAGWPAALGAARDGHPFSGIVEVLRGDGTLMAAEAEMHAAGRGGPEAFVLMTLRLEGAGGPGSAEWDDLEAEAFLALLQLHVEDLFSAARGEFSDSARGPAGPASTSRGIEAWQTLDKAGAFLRVFGDLSAARGAHGRWSPVERVRAIGELIAEASLRARPLFPAPGLAVKRKVVEAGSVSHAALARETLVCLLVDCGRAAGAQSAPLDVTTSSAELNGKPAVSVAIQGPPGMAIDRARFAMCRRAADSMDGSLRMEPTATGESSRAKVELLLPLA